MTRAATPLQLGSIPEALQEELVAEYRKIARNFYERRWEPAELSAGKFCEVVYSIIRGVADGSFPSYASKPGDFVSACRRLEQDVSDVEPRSLRILIPRLLPSLYEVRNNRGVGHTGGDVDPNHMDALFVYQSASWVLAELVRIYHQTSLEEAQDSVDRLVEKHVPIVWLLPDGRKRILDPSLSMHEKMLVALYHSPSLSMQDSELIEVVEYSNPSVFRSSILRNAHRQALIDYGRTTKTVTLSPIGARWVEENINLRL